MSKLIIHTGEGVSDALALRLVRKVVEGGRVSAGDKCYCFVTVLNTEQGEARVYADRTRGGSDTFRVWKAANTTDRDRAE